MTTTWDEAVWASGTWTIDDTLPFVPRVIFRKTTPVAPVESPGSPTPADPATPPVDTLLLDILALLIPFPEARLAVAERMVRWSRPPEHPQ